MPESAPARPPYPPAEGNAWANGAVIPAYLCGQDRTPTPAPTVHTKSASLRVTFGDDNCLVSVTVTDHRSDSWRSTSDLTWQAYIPTGALGAEPEAVLRAALAALLEPLPPGRA